MLGVYPSALHVRWTTTLDDGEPISVGALAVDCEPVCFWDGRDAAACVDAWRGAVAFPGDGAWGRSALRRRTGRAGSSSWMRFFVRSVSALSLRG